jgi:RimJ/RimL family protein N-acetyltransferase
LSQFLGHLRKRPLFARVAKHNAASLRVLQKCGFTILGEDRVLGPNGPEGEEYILRLDEGAAHETPG